MSEHGPVVPVFTWVTVENEARSDGTMTTQARRKLVIDVDGWNWLRAQVPDRTATLLLELAILSERDPRTGVRFVSASQRELGRMIGRGQRGWGEDTLRDMVGALTSLGLLREVPHRPLGPAGGSTPKVLVLEGALFTVAAALAEPAEDSSTRPAGKSGVGLAGGDGRLPEKSGVGKVGDHHHGVPAGQVTSESSESRPLGASHGISSMDGCSSIQHPAPRETAGALVLLLTKLGFGDAARVVAVNDDLAWVTGWVQAVLANTAIPNKGGYLRKLIDPEKRGLTPRSDPPGWIPGTTVALGATGLVLTAPTRTGSPGVSGALTDPADLERDLAVLAHYYQPNPADLDYWRRNPRLRAAQLQNLAVDTGLTPAEYAATHLSAQESA